MSPIALGRVGSRHPLFVIAKSFSGLVPEACNGVIEAGRGGQAHVTALALGGVCEAATLGEIDSVRWTAEGDEHFTFTLRIILHKKWEAG